MKKIIALRTESIELDSRMPNTIRSTMDRYMEHTRDEHIRDLYRRLGKEALNDPSIPPIKDILPNLDMNPPSVLPNQDEILIALSSLLNTTCSASKAASRDVRSVEGLTDAEFEELKAISNLQLVEFQKHPSQR